MFGTILADPAWKFNDAKASMVKTGKGASSHYECMPLPQILTYLQDTNLPGTDTPLADCIEDNAHLWLWVPNAFAVDGTGAQVARAWGFEPKTLVTWCKGRLDIEWVEGPGISTQFERIEKTLQPRPKIVNHIGQGTWIRNSTEQVIFCVRGKAPAAVHNINSSFVSEPHPDEWFLDPRTQHSRKPDRIHEWAEKMSPGLWLELFARRPREGWTSIGNEIDKA